MAKHLEIEIKWSARKVDRRFFNDAIRKELNAQSKSFRFLKVGGYDTYYRNRHGDVIRHREGGGTKELTAKGRVSFDSIKIRREVNVRLHEDADKFDVLCLLKMCGFAADLRIYKTCDIYFFHDDGAEVSVVWYLVRKDGKTRRFLEVEVEGVNKSRSLKVLDRWAAWVESTCGLDDAARSDLSLYEIYADKRYKVQK